MMERRTAMVVTVTFLLFSFVIIQLADPQFGQRTPPEVDYSEPPAEVAAGAATQFEYMDYAYRIDFRRNHSDEWRQVRTMKIDHSDREYYKTGPNGENGVVVYGTDAIAFVKSGKGTPWRATADSSAVYPARTITQPFRPDIIRNSKAERISENSSSVLIKIHSHPIKIAQYSRGTAILSINKDANVIEWGRISYSPSSSETLHLYFRLTSTGSNVDRPETIALSIREFILDVVRGPIVNLI